MVYGFNSRPSHEVSHSYGILTEPLTQRGVDSADLAHMGDRGDIARATALAAAVEALATGHARVLAGELAKLLAGMAGPSAVVVPITGGAKPGRGRK